MAESSEEKRKNLDALLDMHKDETAHLKKQLDIAILQKDSNKQLLILTQQRNIEQQKLNELHRNASILTEEEKNEAFKLKRELEGIADKEKEINESLKKGIRNRQIALDLTREFGKQLKAGWKYLQEQDKIIKSTVLNLGLSGAKSAEMRKSFEDSAGFAYRLGANLTDIQSIMTGFADETGRAHILTEKMVENVVAMGKGTGLGIEGATQLAAQFEYMGVDVKQTMNFVQGVVDTSERMGVNTTKVLKNINNNFKKLNTYTFQQGVKGLGEMATYAELFKVDITEALNAADVARSLEGAIDLAAQLQIMGGEFAKTDPFEMLFLSRNDPAKFTEKLSEMTRGIVTFRKNSEGIMEKFISPADRDRLRNVAKSLNMSVEQMTLMAERRAEMDKLGQAIGGFGLSKEQKEALQGASKFNSENGKFQVKVGQSIKNVSELTATQAKSFANEAIALAKRAEDARTFNEVLQATLQEIKAGLLPLVDKLNNFIERVTPKLKSFAKWFGDKPWKAIGLLVSGAMLWKTVAFLLNKAALNWVATGRAFIPTRGRAATGGIRGFLGGGGTATAARGGRNARMFTPTGQIRKGAAGLTKAQGGRALASGGGMAAAMVGAGAGIALAAVGISKLADAMSRLTPEQAEVLASIVKSLAWFMVGAAVAAVGIMAIGLAGTAGAVGLLAFGAAMLLVGTGIGIAALGISKIVDSLANLVTAGGDAGAAMKGIGQGMMGVAGALAIMSYSGGRGLSLFSRLLRRINKQKEGLTALGSVIGGIGTVLNQANFGSISSVVESLSNFNVEPLMAAKTVLSGMAVEAREIKSALASINSVNTTKNNQFKELSRLLSTPIKVEFADKQVAVVSNITLEIDGQKFHQATKTGAYVRNNYIDSKGGKGGGES